MFGFLKEKLKGIISKFTKKVEAEAKEEVVPVKVEKKPAVKPKVVSEAKVKKPAREVEPAAKIVAEKPVVGVLPEMPVRKIWPVAKALPEKPAEVPKPPEELPEPKPIEKKGFFAKIKEAITTKRISEKQFDEMFWDLELALLENNVAVEVICKIKSDLKQGLVDRPILRTKVQEAIISSLRSSITGLFPASPPDLVSMVRQKKPFVMCFIGVNGSGKTTSIAKVAHLLRQNGLSVVLAAADTFRAAAIDQLQVHADRLGIRLVRHDYGSDPAAVAFDAVKHARAAGKDAVLIDTAGRLHSNTNLMDEMKKIVRVAKPDLKLFVGESITGNDCVEQARQFDEAVGIDGVILAKADVDEKGGAALSVGYITKKPVFYLGTGQEYSDLRQFDKEKLLASIGL